MRPHPPEPRPFFKLRCWQVAAFFSVFLSGGHIMLPQIIAFLRFLNTRYEKSGWDYLILLCACGAVATTFIPLRRAALLLDVTAAALFFAALVLAQWKWADPFDLSIVLITGAPWAITTVILIACDATDPPPKRLGYCPKCGYDRTGILNDAKCPECGSGGTPA